MALAAVADATDAEAAPAQLDNLTLARKEGWQRFVDAPARVQPDPLTRAQLQALGAGARAEYDRQRRGWHANLGPIKTPQLAAVHEDLWNIVDSNAQDGDRAKGAIALDAFPAWVRRPRCWRSRRSSTSARSARRGRAPVPGRSVGRCAGSV